MTTTQKPSAPYGLTALGSRWERGRDIAEIAKDVRRDIKAAVKAGNLPADVKFSVRISRFSMGKSLDVRATLPDRPARRAIETGYGYTHEAATIIAVVKSITDAYNYDASDSLTDYYNVEFYSDVIVSGTGPVD